MGYYARAFCTSPDVPPLRQVLEWAEDRGVGLTIGPGRAGVDLDSPDWREVELVYKQGRQPILCEVNRDDSSDDNLLREEVEDFLESLDDVDDSPDKDRVVQHLRETRFVVASQLLTSDFDDDVYKAINTYLSYFVEHCGGMIQADGEGFYEGDDLIVESE